MITCIFESGNKGLLRHVCIDTLVIKDNKILLAKRTAGLLEGGKWGLIGGYVERDETTKQAVMREVLEETGFKIKDIQLLTVRDNPDRPHEDRQNFSFVFFCEATEKIGQPDWESTSQVWFAFDALPKKEEFAFDHYKNIELYLKYKNEKFSIPVFP